MRLLASVMLVLVAACGGGGRGPARPAPPAWQQVEGGLYLYPETIEAYAPDDRGGYVVRLAPDLDEARAGALRAELGAGDDIVGDDGHVVRLSAAARDALAGRPGVRAIEILQPAARRSALTAGDGEARIELFADAGPDEVERVAAWIAARGGAVAWKGRAALRARLTTEVRAEAARLSAVRWIE